MRSSNGDDALQVSGLGGAEEKRVPLELGGRFRRGSKLDALKPTGELVLPPTFCLGAVCLTLLANCIVNLTSTPGSPARNALFVHATTRLTVRTQSFDTPNC